MKKKNAGTNVIWIYVVAILIALSLVKIIDAPPSKVDTTKIHAPSTRQAIRNAIEKEEIRRGGKEISKEESDEEIANIVSDTMYKEIRK